METCKACKREYNYPLLDGYCPICFHINETIAEMRVEISQLRLCLTECMRELGCHTKDVFGHPRSGVVQLIDDARSILYPQSDTELEATTEMMIQDIEADEDRKRES